jgi:hypothetical protein
MTVADVRTLEAKYWQPRLGALGEVVEGLEDIHQCLLIILSTPWGSDPLRPRFALDLMAYLSRAFTVVGPAFKRDVVLAIAQWEPRARVLGLRLEEDLEGRKTLEVRWEPTGVEPGPSVVAVSRITYEPAPANAAPAIPQLAIPFAGSFALQAVDGGTF